MALAAPQIYSEQERQGEIASCVRRASLTIFNCVTDTGGCDKERWEVQQLEMVSTSPNTSSRVKGTTQFETKPQFFANYEHPLLACEMAPACLKRIVFLRVRAGLCSPRLSGP